MASDSYYHPHPDPPHPVVTAEMFSMRPKNNGYAHVPSRPMEDAIESEVHVSAQEPLRSTKRGRAEFSRLKQQKYEKLKRLVRIVKLLSRIVSSLFSLIMFGMMVFTVVKFLTTKDTVRGGRTPWPEDPKLWPTIMLLAGSAFTLITSTIILFSYCCCYARTQRSWKITLAQYAVHIISWAIISFLYRYERGLNGRNNDLWGWTCAKKAKEIQEQFNGVIDFAALCKTQVSLPLHEQWV